MNKQELIQQLNSIIADLDIAVDTGLDSKYADCIGCCNCCSYWSESNEKFVKRLQEVVENIKEINK